MSSGSIPGSHLVVPGTIQELVGGAQPPFVWLQLLTVKPLDKDGANRYKVAVSDGQHYILGMTVSPQLYAAFQRGQLEAYDVVRITNYQLREGANLFVVIHDISLNDVVKARQAIGKATSITKDPAAVPSKEAEPGRAFVSFQPAANAAAAAPAPGVVPTANPPVPAASRPSPFTTNVGQKRDLGTTPAPSAAVPAHEEEPGVVVPILTINPYNNRWTIKARITNKSDIKKFANKRGEGKLFSCTLIDSSGEIRMTAFGDAVDRFYDMVQEGQVYYISNAQVRLSKPGPYKGKHDYEIHLEPTSLVSLVRDDPADVPKARFSFVNISSIAGLEKDANCDVIGVVKEVMELGSVVTKTTGKTLSKRDIILVDQSHCSIRLTLWGSQAENFVDSGNYPIMAIKGARVSDYNGRTLSTGIGSQIMVNPDIREAHQLRGWYDSQGIHEASTSLSTATSAAAQAGGSSSFKDDRKSIKQIKEENMGCGEKPDYFSLLATIMYIKSDSNISYPACPGEGCSKKVVEEGPGVWRCEKCQKVFDRCDHRYIFSLQLGDHTGQTWVNVFNETGVELLGRPAEEMYYMKMHDENAYAAVFREAAFKQFIFRIRARQENYQGEAKLRCNVLSALPVPFVEECKALIKDIDMYL